MAFPSTDFPTALDAAESRTDLVNICYDDDFNYHDEQIRKIQEYFGISAELIGQRIAGKGPGGMVSPIASGASARALRLAARNAFASGYLLSVGDNYDVSYTEKMLLDYLGILWTLGGIDASAMLKIPNSALPLAGVAGRLHWDPGTPALMYDDGGSWNQVGATGAGSYIDMAADYSYTVAAVPVEEVIGQGVFDGSLVTGALVAYFRAIISVVLTSAGPIDVKLYDMGPKAGPPAAPTLITTLSTLSAGGPQVLEQALSVGASPGANQIANSARMYELTVIQSTSPGDSNYIGSAGLDVR